MLCQVTLRCPTNRQWHVWPEQIRHGSGSKCQKWICETLGFQSHTGCYRSCLPDWERGFLVPAQWTQGPPFQQPLKDLIVVYPFFYVRSCSFSVLFISRYPFFFFLLGRSLFFLFSSRVFCERPFTKGIWIFLPQKAQLVWEWQKYVFFKSHKFYVCNSLALCCG